MIQIFVDTAFVVALINQCDKDHQEAVELSRKFENYPLLVTDVVLLEISNLLVRNYKREAIELIEAYINSEEVEIIHLTPQLFDRAFKRYKKYQDKQWGLVDCLSFEVMEERGIRYVLTFDHDFAQAGFQILTSKISPA